MEGVTRVELTKQETEKAYGYALEILSKRFPRIKEDDFIDLYGQERVDQVKTDTEKIKRGFEKPDPRKEQRGIIFEAMFLDLLQNFWFKSIKFIRSSEIDDYVNKVDAILTKNNPSSPNAMGLSMDPTTSIQSLSYKERKIKDNNGLTNIDFFMNGNFKGKLTGVPHVALYLDDTTFTQLIRLWYNLNSDKYSEKEKANSRKQLESHPAQIDLLKQMIYQLKLTESKLTQKHKSDSEIVSLGITKEYIKLLEGALSLKETQIRMQMKADKYDADDMQKELTNLPGLKAVKEIFK